MPETPRRPPFLWVVLVALSVALAFWVRWQFILLYGGRESSYVVWANEHYFGGLSSFYLNGADRWARGERYTELVYPPGYVAILGTIYRLGLTHVNQIRMFQAAVDSMTVCAVYLLAQTIGLKRLWALVAALTYAVLPLWAAGSTFLLAESLSATLVLWALVIVQWSQRGSPLNGVVAGAWLGASALTRSDLALFIIPVAFWLLLAKGPKASLKPLVVIATVFAIFIGGWGLHNKRVHGSWVFGSTSSGAGLWEGLGEIPNNYGYVLGDSETNQTLRARGLQWSSVEANQYLTRDYLRAWREHPGFVIRAASSRIRHILFQSERLQPLFFGRFRQILDGSGLAVLVAAILLKRRDTTAVVLLAVLPLYAVATIGLIHYEPRYVRYVPVAYVLGLCVVGARLFSLFEGYLPRLFPILAMVTIAVGCAYVGRELHSLHVMLGTVKSFPP